MKTVGMFEAKTKLSEICALVSESGEKIVITRRGVPFVELSPLQTQRPSLIERLEACKRIWPSDEDAPDFELPPREPAEDKDLFGDESE